MFCYPQIGLQHFVICNIVFLLLLFNILRWKWNPTVCPTFSFSTYDSYHSPASSPKQSTVRKQCALIRLQMCLRSPQMCGVIWKPWPLCGEDSDIGGAVGYSLACVRWLICHWSDTRECAYSRVVITNYHLNCTLAIFSPLPAFSTTHNGRRAHWPNLFIEFKCGRRQQNKMALSARRE